MFKSFECYIWNCHKITATNLQALSCGVAITIIVSKEKSVKNTYNHGHNILKLFDTLPNFLFTTSETKRDY